MSTCRAKASLTVAGVVGTSVISGYSGQLNLAFRAAQVLGSDNLRRLIVPGILAAGKFLAIFSTII